MADNGTTSVPSMVKMAPTLPELLVPPLACLACICVGLVVWVLIIRCKSKKKNNYGIHNSQGSSCSLRGNGHDNRARVSPCPAFNASPDRLFPLSTSTSISTDKPPTKTGHETSFASVRPLFETNDLDLIRLLQGQGPVNVRELVGILTPVICSLGFCPLTLLLHGPIVKLLWPPEVYPVTPNINDAIACYLVPAGMVYAISFGFAFQMVTGAFQETSTTADRQAGQAKRLLTLVTQLDGVAAPTRVAMLRLVKDLALTSASMLLGQPCQTKEPDEDLDALLHIMYTVKTENPDKFKADTWQSSVFSRLENLISEDVVLTANYTKISIHAVQWAFLESLGYMAFLGILLVDCSSYRANLSICLITVICISLLCYIVADLDSPFYGVFRVDLDCFLCVIRRLDDEFNRAAADVMLMTSIAIDERKQGNKM